MEDDIDIEEHDVLDNPRLRTIFPDLARIKTEIPDHDFEDNLEYKPYSEAEGTSSHNPEEEYTRYSNKIILGSKPNTNSKPVQTSLVFGQPVEIKQEIPDEENLDDDGLENNAQSMIIIGSKPSFPQTNHVRSKLRFESESYEDGEEKGSYEDKGSYEEKEKVTYEIKDAVIALKDWGPILKTSPSYCKQCLILFPTPNTLQAHNMTAHSFLVALESNKAVKSTAKEAIPKPGKYCNHCNKTFPDSDSLINHLYESLTFDKNNKKLFMPQKSVAVKSTGIKVIGSNKSVPATSKAPIPTPKAIPTPTKIPISSEKVTAVPKYVNKLVPNPNKTVVSALSHDNSAKVGFSQSDSLKMYRCSVCSIFFSGRTRFLSHSKRHGIQNPDMMKVSYNPQCNFCEIIVGANCDKLEERIRYSKHIYRKHGDMYDKKVVNVDMNASLNMLKTIKTAPVRADSKIETAAAQAKPKYLCKICGLLLNSKYAARAHKKREHSIFKNETIFKKINPPKGVVAKKPKPVVVSKANKPQIERYKCLLCGKIFRCYILARQHRAMAHPETKNTMIFKKLALTEVKPVKALKVAKKLEDPSEVAKTSADDSEKFECLKCGQIFSQYESARSHRLEVHPETKNTVIFRKLNNTGIRLLQKTIKLPKINENAQKVRKTNEIEATEQDEIASKCNLNVIPKLVLFCCKTCNLHYATSKSATAHFSSCKTNKSAACDVCQKKFDTSELPVHKMQHRFGSDYEIYKFDETNLIGRVWHQCPDCLSYLDDKLFWSHIENCTNVSQVTACAICNIQVHDSCAILHKKWHKDSKLSKLQIITIKYEKITKAVKRKLQVPDENKPKRRRKSMGLLILFCNKCETFLSSDKRHSRTPCKKNGRKRFVCIFCGLVVNSKSHKKIHESHPKATILDMTFVPIRDLSKPIVPPIPEYEKCDNCNTHFCKKRSVWDHTCDDNHKTCNYCNKKFSDLAYKLHIKFHEYAIKYGEIDTEENSEEIEQNEESNDDSEKIDSPTEDVEIPEQEPNLSELMKKYEMISNIWNLLYRCETCDTITDEYDKAVEHAQKHYINTENLDVTIVNCKVCDLNFESTSYDRHKDLHSQNSTMNKKSFKILSYDYSSLVSNKWLEMFDQLNRPQVKEMIVSKSIYNKYRWIKMRVMKAGPAEYVLYKCVRCNAFCSPIHARYDVCSKGIKKHVCRLCKRIFTSQDSKESHLSRHNDVDDYKIVFINEPGDEKLNQKLSDAVFEQKKQFPGRFHFYKCSQCKACIVSRIATSKHVCTPTKTCAKCKLQVSVYSLANHMILHRSNYFKKEYLKFTLFTPKTANTRCVINKTVVARPLPRSQPRPQPKHEIVLYKCVCDLHFTSKDAGAKHVRICNPKSEKKISMEKCSKCDRLFDTTQLFIHLCNHLAKDKDLKYEIVRIGPKKKIFSRVFKCMYCECVYVGKENCHKHICYSNKDVVPCDQCGMKYADVDHNNCTGKQAYCTLKGPDRNKIVFICKECDLCFINYDSAKYHFERNHQTGFPIVPCSFCGLKFLSSSNKKHAIIHENDPDMTLDELNFVACIIKDYKAFYDPCLKPAVQVMDESDDPKPYGRKTRKSINNQEMNDDDDMEVDVERDDESMVPDKTVGTDRTMERKQLMDAVNQKESNNIIYKCKECKVHYYIYASIEAHSCADRQIVKKCGACGYKFLRSNLESHNLTHHDLLKLKKGDFKVITYRFDGNKLVETIDSDNEEDVAPKEVKPDVSIAEENDGFVTDDVPTAEQKDTFVTDDLPIDVVEGSKMDIPEATKVVKLKERSFENVIAKCGICDISYILMDSFLVHAIRCHVRKLSLPLKVDCKICHLKFEDTSLFHHEGKHHRQDSSNELFVMTMHLVGSTVISKYVFQCKTCLVTFGHNIDEFKEHINGSFHFVITNRCEQCKLLIDPEKFTEHNEKCRRIMKIWKSQDLVILQQVDDASKFVVTEQSLEENKVASEIRKENIVKPATPTRNECEPKSITEKITTLNQDLYTNEIFKCSECSLHFLTRDSLNWHVKNLKHQVLRIHCTVCRFAFTPEALPVHVFIHHDKLNFKAHEFYVISNVDDISASTTPDCTPAVSSGKDTNKSMVKSPVKEKCSTNILVSDAKDDVRTNIDNDKPSTSHQQELEHQIGAADSSGASDETTENDTASAPTNTVANIIKLYKCGSCNVCFLTQQSCYKHTTNHVPLDAKNYIECKLCGYQFPIANTLQYHMSKHHKIAFRPENVLIEEYHPDILYQGVPKIDIYKGTDRVQSKLVSTTTEKDNNVVDSTVSSSEADVLCESRE